MKQWNISKDRLQGLELISRCAKIFRKTTKGIAFHWEEHHFLRLTVIFTSCIFKTTHRFSPKNANIP